MVHMERPLINRTELKLVATALALVCAPSAVAGAGTQPHSDLNKVDALFARYAGQDVPGCAIAATKNGRKVIERAYGSADLEHGVPNTGSTIFEAGSVSKQFTAAAILLLAEEGRLKLTDDVRRFVPEMPNYGHEITLEHLLSHTSGLRDWGEVSAIAGWPRGTRAYTPADVLDIARRQWSLNYTPGSEYSYTNTGYNLLALIVERLSGKTLSQFTRERLFVPLGMNSTRWRDDFRQVVKKRAIAYEPRNGVYVQAMPFEDAYGNGGLLTTVGDLIIWTEALSNGRLASAIVSLLQGRATLTNGKTITYARGLFVQPYRSLQEVSHGGTTGGYRAWLGRYPQHGVSIALLCNSGDANTASLAHGIAEQLLPKAGPDVAAPAARLQFENRAGLFVNERTGFPMRISVVDGKLKVDEGPFLDHLSPSRFRLSGSELVFQTSASFSLTSPEGQTSTFIRTAAANPSRAELERLTGQYFSDEAGASYIVRMEEGALVMRLDRKPDAVFKLTPLYKNAFGAGSRIVRFYGEGRRPSSLGIGSSRVRDLRFVRIK